MTLARQVPPAGKQFAAIRRITSALGTLSPAERRVAERVLEDPGQVVVLSIGDFAESCGVAQPTLSRFARSVGFANYPALRFAIAHDIATEGRSSEETVPGLDRMRDDLQSDSALGDLVGLLRFAPAVDVWGSGDFAGSAALVAARLQSRGVRAAASGSPSHWVERSAGLAPGTVVLVMAAAPDRMSDRALAVARSHGARVAIVSAEVFSREGVEHTLVLPQADSPELAGAVFADTLTAELDRISQDVSTDGPASPWVAWPHVERLLVQTDGDPVPVILLDREPGVRHPLVIFFSGFTAEKEQGMAPGAPRNRISPGMVAAILNAGYSVLLMDAPAHGDRKRTWESPRDLVEASMAGSGPDLQQLSRETMPFVVDAVVERGIVDSPQQIAIVGQSWGGYQTLLALEGDPRVRGGVAVMPITHASDLPEFSPYRDSDRGASATISHIEPPLLIVSGLDDTVATPERARELHERLLPSYFERGVRDDLRLEELAGVGHHLDARQVGLIIGWLDEYLQ